MSCSLTRRLGAALSVLVALFLLAGAGGPPQARAATSPHELAAADPANIAPFLDEVLGSVGDYWHETFAADGRLGPSVSHVWVVPRKRVDTACGVKADDNAAFYCSLDDTIYVGQAFATAIHDGVAKGLPGQQAGYGRAAGDFAVAYVVAHEYGHNVQEELGTMDGHLRALPIELNADCLAGTWARWAYGKGELNARDAQEALDAALAVGDFDVLSPQHHGTPQERRDALLTGMRSGSPSACDEYLDLL
jgi:uncharacterized protein